MKRLVIVASSRPSTLPTHRRGPIMATNDPLVDALRPFAAALVVAVKDELAKQSKGTEGPRYYDAKNAPMGKTAFLRLAKDGAFPSFKVGKRIRALASDVHAYMER